MTEKKRYIIQARSVEEFKEIEEAYKNLEENYNIEGDLGGDLLLTKGLNRIFRIWPESKYGIIKKIIAKDNNIEGKLLAAGSGTWNISVGKRYYRIDEKNPYFKDFKD